MSAAVDLFDWFFVGTYCLSSHARLEAFVVQTKLNYKTLQQSIDMYAFTCSVQPGFCCLLCIKQPDLRAYDRKGNLL
jgi:hypothetical protein